MKKYIRASITKNDNGSIDIQYRMVESKGKDSFQNLKNFDLEIKFFETKQEFLNFVAENI